MIKGLSEMRRLPRVGKIRLGVKNKNEQGAVYPTAVDYFVFEEKGLPKEITKKIKELYGEKPRELIIRFFSNDLEQIFPQYLKYYKSGQLFCKGDGEKARRRKDSGELEEIRCPYKDCPYYQQKLCRPIAHLKFYLEGIPGGFFQIDTSSINTIININTKIEQLKMIYGNIVNVPLRLNLIPIQVQVKGNKDSKSFNKTTYIMDINEIQENTIEKQNKNTNTSITNVIADEDFIENDMPEEFSEDKEEIPEGFEVIEDGEDPFTKEEQKEMLMLNKFGKIQIKGKDYVIATFMDSQNKTYNFIIPNKEIFKGLNEIKKSGKTPIIYDYRTEDFNGYKSLIEYKVLTL
ncbi:hypothetical protein SAMN04244560_00856 [Thermoanaerobacter thermohydrosulfuricus]|uniref:Uncharacterized protein n=1 Tax=Thermoanaerobacter thermohydrosulfuricus TaxID=1516 RepID=A0A1G7LT02_THETY|nr:hypothetical protein [Thermoanaerobacter thermohydrosulfuricus]SDF52100.1 hypothetical protein SAMN04244560_00856 [Thermoanaerobacter thermohydrosulfuricus]